MWNGKCTREMIEPVQVHGVHLPVKVACATCSRSSISFCKSALESINGFDLFAEDAGATGVIYVDADAHSRNRIVLGHFLPRYYSLLSTLY